MEKTSLMKTYNQLLLIEIEQKKLERLRLEATSDRSQAPRFDEIALALDDYYFLNQLQLYCAYLSYKKMVRPELLNYDAKAFKLIGPIVKYIESGEVSNPFLQIYNQIRILLEEKELSTSNFNALFDQTFHLINNQNEPCYLEIKQEALSFLSNLSIRKMNEGKERFIESMFEVNNQILNLRYIETGNNRFKIEVGLFKNMVVTAFKISNIDFFKKLKTVYLDQRDNAKGFESATTWSTVFVQQCKNKLIKKERDKYVSFCEAYIAFQNNDFIKAYKILNNPTRLRGMFINMSIRQLHLQVLLDLELSNNSILEKDDVDIKNCCESLRKLISDDKKRKKQLSYHADYFETFEKIYRQMIRLYYKYRLPYMTKGIVYEKEMGQFLQVINTCTYPYKNWFENKYTQVQQAH